VRPAARVLYIASLAAFMRSFSQVIYVPSQIEILHDLGMTTALFGLTLSVFALTFAIAQLFLGPVVDRYDSKQVLLGGLLLFIIGNLGGFFVQSMEAFFLIRVLQALGIAAAVIVGIALISDVIAESERGHAIGLFDVFNAAGAAAGPLIGALIAVWIGWRADFIILGILGIALALFAYRQLPRQTVHTQRAGFREMAGILRTPSTFGAALVGFVQFYALFTVFTLLPVMLNQQFGLGAGRIGLLISLLPIGAMIGSLLGGRACDRVNIRSVLIPGSVLALFAFSGLTLFSRPTGQSASLVFVAGVVFAAGFGIGFSLPAQLKNMVDYFPALRGTASGLSLFFRFLGATLSPVITGYLADAFGLPTGYGSAAILLAVGAVVSFLTIKEPAQAAIDGLLNPGRSI